MKYLSILPFFFLGLFFTACSEEVGAQGPELSKLPIVNVNDVPVKMELAISKVELETGLMFRKQLEKNQGMLFVFAKAGNRSFWMKNTLIPLDIGYFDASGMLLEVHSMEPQSLRSVVSRSDKILYALEMNQGWYEKNSIKPGAKLNNSQLIKAIEEKVAR